ncbi:MAG: HEPN domain-containing protein [bacterium]
MIGDARVDQQQATQWSTSGRSILAQAYGTDCAHYVAFHKHGGGHIAFTDAFRAQGVLKAAADDLSGGHLFDLRQLIEAEVFDDFLEQAEHLHAAGYHPAAAVIAGCVLEEALRNLCAKHSVAVAPKPKLDQMNADLAKVGAYSKLIQKRVTALADLRNKAAHGEWTDFNADDVEKMLKSVRRFLEEYHG